MKILKNFILSLLQTDNLPSDLTYKQRRIIKYTNYGALIVSIIPLLLGIIFFILNPDYFNKNYWTLGISLLYLSIPFINKFQYYELSKIVALLLITVDLVSPDFIFFVFLYILVLFFENSIYTYEQRMNSSLNDLESENKNLTFQQKLKKSEQFFTSFFENGQLGFVIIDKEGHIVNLNQTFTQQVKISEEKLLDTNFFELCDANEYFKTQYNLLLNGQINHFEIEESLIKTDKNIVAHLMISGVFDMHQSFVEAIITVQDITVTNQVNKRLQESESKFKSLFDNSPLGITIRTADKKELVEVNQMVLDKLGLTKQEFLDIDRNQFFEKNIALTEDTVIIDKIINGELLSFTNDMLFYTKDKKPLYFQMTRSKVIINDIPCIMAVCEDVTERHLIEEERKKQYEETQLFFDALPIAFLYVDTNHQIIRVNNRVQRDFKEPIEGKYLQDLFPEFKKGEISHSKVIKSGEPDINQIEKFVLFNEVRWQKVSRIPVKDKNGQVEGLMIFSTDITAIKDAETNLASKNEELEQYIKTNLQLESFAYIVSHDLKEPLRMIYSFTQLLHQKLKPHFDKDAIDFMNYVLDGAKRMELLLDDLLKYSTIGKKENSLELVNLNETVYDVIQNLQLVIEEKNAQINIGALPELEVFPVQMLQLFQNLISNALKFVATTRNPIIEINVEEKTDEYVFSVLDNGIGIDKEYLDKIFLVFRRLHSKEAYSGTGIGLATCKKIVENHMGRIWLSSTVDVGTTFYFSIPKNSK